METTGKQFVEFWNWAANKELMKPNTARSFAAPAKQVMSIDEDWETQDVSTLDVDDLLNRFRDKRGQDFKPDSLQAYERRFRQALDLFKKYVHDPANWKFKKQTSPTRKTKAVRSEKLRGAPTATMDHEPTTMAGIAYTSMVDYPFVLRENCIVRLKLPVDLRLTDIDRLTAFLRTLVIDINQT